MITAADHQLRRLKKHQQNLKNAPTTLGAGNEKAKLLSNKTHYSPTDPDARISIKPGKARKLNYHCSLAVDTAEGVISHVQTDFADGRDSQYLPDIALKLQQRLAANELRLEEVLADTGYSNGGNYALLEGWKITDGPPAAGYLFSANTNHRSKAFRTILRGITLLVQLASDCLLRPLPPTPKPVC